MNIVNLAQWPAHVFPDPGMALDEPDGLLAIGGDLSPTRLLSAYRSGIFPWYGASDPILWWSPDPRAVFWPGQVHCSRRLKRKLRKHSFRATRNRDFAAVMRHCAAPRNDDPQTEQPDEQSADQGTWLHADMQAAYLQLHQLGHAHSVEVFAADDSLAGGLYGVVVDRVFCAESMFSSQTDGSKIALLALSDWTAQLNFKMIDAQMMTPHLASLGAQSIPRRAYLQLLQEHG
jgi:leucyl/phenylalanyl-tRNA---protein transferase